LDIWELFVSAGLSDLSPRDNRTQPGVLTPGIRPHHDTPEGA
jgi:hypothetical protein